MNIVIAGAGKVGFTIAERLCREGHDITLIDEKRASLDNAANSMDVMGVCGSCAAPSVLKEAEAGEADVFIAATGNDEANLVACQFARKMGAKHTIARLRNQEYLDSGESLREIMDLNLAINPDYVTAEVISRVLQFPAATQVDSFPDCELEIVTFRIGENSRLDGMKLKELPTKLRQKRGERVLVCCAERGGEFRIPDGNFELHAGDRISVTAPTHALRHFFKEVTVNYKPAKRVILLGGSRIAVHLTQLLQSTGGQVTILDRNYARCQTLSELLRGADIICADGADITVLQQSGLYEADGFVALTNYDEDNIILSMYAEKAGVEKVVSKVNNDKFIALLRDVFPDSTLSPKNIVAERIEGYVRGLAHASDKSTIEALYYLGDKNVTATEFKVGEKAAVIGRTLAEMKLKPGVLLAAVVHGGKVIVPDGGTTLEKGDRAVVVTTDRSILNLDDILAG
ncbi:MAG: Trk system potassium transporter TrkA [Oscillospiraceae bacterium]|nr:Trk system potassium transporter TrkA [Oscillospiraceae bacterium]